MSPELDTILIRLVKLIANTIFVVAQVKLGSAWADVLRKNWTNSKPVTPVVPADPD
jgi:hypothetical protein